MNRLHQAFQRAEEEGRSALIVYLCAGHPSLELTPGLIEAVSKAGADIIEVGVPFSDPTADGPTIQRASEKALKGGTSVKGVLAAVKQARAKVDTPMVLFSYYNPILKFGEEAFVDAAKDAGADAALVVDLPPEMAGPFAGALRSKGLDYIPLVAPTSSDARIAQVGELADAFIYAISMTGVTGKKLAALPAAAARAKHVHALTKKRVALGFGIRSASDVAQVAKHSAGVVVGSALVDAIDKAATPEEAVEHASELVASLREGTEVRGDHGVDGKVFHEAYEGDAPWETDKPQTAVREAFELGYLKGKVLDLGCGTGENSLFLAEHGQEVLGVDLVPGAIARAEQKRAARPALKDAKLRFQVGDGLNLNLGDTFDALIDSGVFHVFSDEERPQYIDVIRRHLKPGGHLVLVCFSDREPGKMGPRRVSEHELRTLFAEGWSIESLERSRYETRRPEGVEAWRLIATRT